MWLVVAFVILIPIADHTRFSLQALVSDNYAFSFLGRLLPVRIVFLILVFVGLLFFLNHLRAKGFSDLKHHLKTLSQDYLFLTLSGLWIVRLVSIAINFNSGVRWELFGFYTSMIGLYIILKFLFLKFPTLPLQLLKIYVITACTMALYGLVQLLAYMLFGKILPGVLVGGNFIRLPGPFFDANHFPAYLATAAPFLAGYAWLSKSLFKKVAAWAFFYLLTLLILFTFSRSGLIAITVACFFLVYFALRLGMIKKLGPIMIGVILASLLVYVSAHTSKSFVHRIGTIVNPLDKSTNAHLLLLQGAVELFQSSPLYGVGYGSFSERFRNSYAGSEHALIDPATQVRVPAHSLWFESLSETGALGFGLFFGLIVIVLVKIVSTIQVVKNDQSKVLMSCLFASLTALATGAVLYSYNLEFFWFILFISYFLAIASVKAYQEGKLPKYELSRETVGWGEVIPRSLLFVVAAFLILFNLGKTALVDFDEGIYANVAKELRHSGDYLRLTFDGVNWFEKPPLYFWLTAPMIELFQATSYAVRIWPALMGVGTVILVYFLTKRLFGQTSAFFASLILLTSTHFIYFSRNGILESPVTFFMVLSIWFFFKAQEKPWWLLPFGASLALGVLTKGPVALLILIPILGYLLVSGKLKSCFNRQAVVSLCLFIIMAGGWHWLEFLRFKEEFIQSYFSYHILSRVGDPTFEGHSADPWIYLTVIINSLRIWSPLIVFKVPVLNLFLPGLAVIWAVFLAIRSRFWRRPSSSVNRELNQHLIFVLIWVGAILVVFSAAQSRLIHYIFPIYPAIAVLGGVFMAHFIGWVKRQIAPYLPHLATHLTVYVGMVSLVLSLSYLVTQIEKIYPPDYNYDLARLIDLKNRDDKAKGSPTYFFGVHPFVARYYSEGLVDFLAGSSPMSTVAYDLSKKDCYIIAPLSEFHKYYRTPGDFVNYQSKLISVSGNYALLKKF